MQALARLARGSVRRVAPRAVAARVRRATTVAPEAIDEHRRHRQLVEAIAYQKLDQRLAALLVERGSGGSATVQATHQALADDLGSVREIVTRLLRSFEDRGFVELGRERITLRDPAALAALARG